MDVPAKPIETTFDGVKYRSRLEARWSYYFKHFGIKHEYEREGYDLPNGVGYYLPDFWFPQVKMWAEVKPTEFNMPEIVKCAALQAATGFPCLMLDGLPDARSYFEVAAVVDPDSASADYIINADYLSEHRFFSRTGGDYPVPERISDQSVIAACKAAQAHRFW